MSEETAAYTKDGASLCHHPSVELLKQLVACLDDLMGDSFGVSGLHRNGDDASWDWLIENAHLAPLEKARSFLKGEGG